MMYRSFWATQAAVLIECKASAFFIEAKRTAAPEAIIADLRKHLADAEKRKGLFRLYDKCNAVRSKSLLTKLMEKYKEVKRLFPIMLLFDAIEHANAAPVIGNIIKDELEAPSVKDFEYQIWHLEELAWLAESATGATIDWTAEKFSHKNRSMGLNSFTADKTGKHFLHQLMYVPQSNEKAFKILTEL